MDAKLYYTPPDDNLFEELKAKAIELWTERYPEETSPFYAKEKIDRIKDIGNIQDNFMYIVAMFDIENQQLLADKLSMETRWAVSERMIDGGTPPEFIVF